MSLHYSSEREKQQGVRKPSHQTQQAREFSDEDDSREAEGNEHRFSGKVIFKVYQLNFPTSILKISLRMPPNCTLLDSAWAAKI